MEQSVHLREEVCENFTEKCFTLWAVPSSNTNHSEQSLKELAKHRLKTRFDVSNMLSFDEYSEIRSSCHIIEQVNEEFYCDCFLGMKAKLCKHSVGMLYKTELLEVTSDPSLFVSIERVVAQRSCHNVW